MRTLLSMADVVPATISWHGVSRPVAAGHWIVAMDGLPADPETELSVGTKLLQQRTGGPAVKPLGGLGGFGGKGRLLVEAAPDVSYDQLRASFAGLPGFRYVEPDFLVSIDATMPNDPSFQTLAGLDNAGQTGGVNDADIDAPEAWDLSTGSRSIVVGIIDSGVDYNHPDLAANMWRNPGEIPGDGIDNDGNGYKDDVYGYDFLNNDSDPMDDNAHGTHVAGTIAAVGDNGIGVAGVNWQSQVMALKFLGANGSGPISAAIAALNYATKMRTTYGVNIRLTNNSWGGGAFSQALNDAIVASGNAGMLFVAAAGNNASNNDLTTFYPASYDLPNVVVVAATDQNDSLASFSNFGATTVDLAAPGVSILSTTPKNTYSSFSGTSMAAPHVSGVAALAWGVTPNASYQTVRDAMLAGVDLVPALTGRTATGGRLNARNTLDVLLGEPGDTLSTARVIGLDQSGEGFVARMARVGDGPAGAQDVDLYRFVSPANGRFTAATGLPAGGVAVDTSLRLFDATGVPIAFNDDSDGTYSRIDALLPAGTYYLGVSGSPNVMYDPTVLGGRVSGASGDYHLSMSLDLGDTLTTAKATGLVVGGDFLQAGTRLGDGAGRERDVDLYRIDASAGNTLTAASSTPSGGVTVGTALHVFDAAGHILAQSSGGARLEYTFAAEGTYYLGVSGEGNISYDPAVASSGSAGAVGDYRLDLSLDVFTPAEFELSRLLANNSGDRDGFSITGTGNYTELTGPSLYLPVGDVNQDGFDDMLLGEPGDIGASILTVGHAYLIFGRSGGFPADLNLNYLDGTAGYILDGMALGDRVGFSGGGAGDVNHDGIPDLVVGALWGTPSSDRAKAGQSFVLFGGATHLQALDDADGARDGHIALARLDGQHGLTINGAVADDSTGRATGAGDVNGDGVDDLVIGGHGASTGGVAYVVFGRDPARGAPLPAVIELATLNGANGFAIPSPGTGDNLGIAVSGAGDLNGDGIGDLVIGANVADPLNRVSAGQAFVIFGRASFPATFNLATLDGTNGFMVNGAAAGDTLGTSLAPVGDVNGDGLDDLLIGASGADAPGRLNAGATYLILGKRTATSGAFAAVLDAGSISGTVGGTFHGAAAGDGAGANVGWAGDLNGDGYNDILIGAASADPAGQSGAGQSYLIYGGPGVATRFDLAGLLASGGGDGANGYALNGFQAGAAAGRPNGVGDLNGDGIDDLRVGSPYIDLAGITAPGQVYVVYGKLSRPGIRVMPNLGLLTTESGGTARFTVALATRPTADVTIPVHTGDATEGTVAITSLTFTPVNWNIPQAVTITGVNDTYSDGDVAYAILLGVAVSGDADYNGLDPADVVATNVDNDFSTATFTKTENRNIPDRGTYTSSLVVAPTGRVLDLDVRVKITHPSDDDLDVYLIAPDGTRVELFTDILGVNFTNTVLDDEAATPITSGVAPFTGTYRPEGDLAVVEGKGLSGTWKLEVTDDLGFYSGKLIDWSITVRYTAAPRGPSVVVTPTSGLVTTEAGGTAVFTVKLDTAPKADVVIPVASGNAAEGRASVSSLTFTPTNWSIAQTVVVTGVDDLASDGDMAYTILLGPAASTDPDFNRLDPPDVNATNQDNDFVTSTFSKTANQTIPDRTTRTSVLNVTAAGTILDLDVRVSITHTGDADLDVFLIAPDGTRVELFTDVGGTGDNFSGTVLDDEANTSITAGAAPFTGKYRPEGNLTQLEGKNLSGNWTLEVTDDTKNNTGTLASWSLIVRFAPAGLIAANVVTVSPDQAPLTVVQAAPLVAEARARWAVLGADTSALDGLEIRVADLPGGELGSAYGRVLTLDNDAAGHGWFVDLTPAADEEFLARGETSLARPGSDAGGRVDLLSVILHELGHWLGYGHDEHGVMAESLAAGVRKVPPSSTTRSAVRAAAIRPAQGNVALVPLDEDVLTGLATEIVKRNARKHRPLFGG